MHIQIQDLHRLLKYSRNRRRTEYLTEFKENKNCKLNTPAWKIKKVVLTYDDKMSHALWSVAEFEKVLLSKDSKVQGATIKYFLNDKIVVLN